MRPGCSHHPSDARKRPDQPLSWFCRQTWEVWAVGGSCSGLILTSGKIGMYEVLAMVVALVGRTGGMLGQPDSTHRAGAPRIGSPTDRGGRLCMPAETVSIVVSRTSPLSQQGPRPHSDYVDLCCGWCRPWRAGR